MQVLWYDTASVSVPILGKDSHLDSMVVICKQKLNSKTHHNKCLDIRNSGPWKDLQLLELVLKDEVMVNICSQGFTV